MPEYVAIYHVRYEPYDKRQRHLALDFAIVNERFSAKDEDSALALALAGQEDVAKKYRNPSVSLLEIRISEKN